jgi:hypothetical protein
MIKFQKALNKWKKAREDHYELISKEQTLALFHSFKRISELFLILSGIQQSNLIQSKKHKRAVSSDIAQGLKPGFARPNQPGMRNAGSLENSINISSVTANLVKDPEANLNDESMMHNPRMMNVRPDESMSFMNDTRIMNETIDIKPGSLQNDDAYLMTSTKRPHYIDLFDEDAQSSDEVIGFLLKVKIMHINKGLGFFYH